MSPRSQEAVTPQVPDEWDALAKETLVRREEPVTSSRPINIDYAVAQFCHYYPGEFKDGEIGWRKFWMLYNHLPRLSAIQRWNMTQAVLMGEGLVNAGDEGRRRLQKQHEYDLKFGSDLID